MCEAALVENEKLKKRLSELTKSQDELKSKLDDQSETASLAKIEIEAMKIKLSANKDSTSEDQLVKKSEELELVKQLVIERDGTIKKLQDSHQKDISSMKLKKKDVEDELS